MKRLTVTNPEHGQPGVGMKIAVVGHKGMLGRDLSQQLRNAGHNIFGFGRPQTDITDPKELNSQLRVFRPELVINCAAYTAVDQAESEPERAFRVNRDGARILAEACSVLGVPLIHVSTDYVFDGTKATPYEETNPANPLNVYGRSKWEGEEAVRCCLREHLIIRTSWLYGCHGNNFVKTMVKLARERECVRVVNDQYGSPTWTRDLAGALMAIGELAARARQGMQWGTYHFSGSGTVTWFDFAQAVIYEGSRFEKFKITRLISTTSKEYYAPATRPSFSVLDCEKIHRSFGITTPPWRASLRSMIKELFAGDECNFLLQHVMAS